MSLSQSLRQKQKAASRERILLAASLRLRAQGLDGPAIGPVMKEAGLTHGAFTAHFKNKDELTREAFRFAIAQMKPHWVRTEPAGFAAKLIRMAGEYLEPRHIDNPWEGCVIAALATEVTSARSDDFRQLYTDEMLQMILSIAELERPEDDPERYEQAIAFLAICVGGISLAKNTRTRKQAITILNACHEAVRKLNQTGMQYPNDKSKE